MELSYTTSEPALLPTPVRPASPPPVSEWHRGPSKFVNVNGMAELGLSATLSQCLPFRGANVGRRAGKGCRHALGKATVCSAVNFGGPRHAALHDTSLPRYEHKYADLQTRGLMDAPLGWAQLGLLAIGCLIGGI
jgi:hypothetical protein